MIPIIVVFLIGTAAGVTVTTNEPKVADFGHKYLSAEPAKK